MRISMPLVSTLFIGVTLVGFLAGTLENSSGAVGNEDTDIAQSLAAMLRSGRAVISRNQGQINDPAIGDKGLDAKKIVADTLQDYQAATGVDALSMDSGSRHGRLLRAQIDAISEVVDTNQQTINKQGVGFKGFIPAVFARLVNEGFIRRVGNEAEMKVTAPPELVRNRKARPDTWELDVIKTRFSDKSWPKGQLYSAVVDNRGRQAYRVAVPEYYAASCLSCHGVPKGETDVTGYPKEGAAEGDLGGVMSIILYH
jgi:Protein of unknown function (DUF3365)